MTLGLMLFATALSAQLPREDREEPRMVGNDRDEHGCIGSAGYVWSEVKKECIRTFEVGTRLDPVSTKPGDAVMSSFIILASNNKKAELYVPSVQGSVILKRSGKAKTWKAQNFVLKQVGEKYTLSVDGKEAYKN